MTDNDWRHAMEEKLDKLLELSHDREMQMKDMSAQITAMAPTVKQVADALTFAKIGRSVFRVFVGVGMFMTPIILWVTDSWHIIVQLLRRG